MQDALFCCRISQHGTRLSRISSLTLAYLKTAFSLFGWFWSFENRPETLHLQTHEKSSSRRGNLQVEEMQMRNLSFLQRSLFKSDLNCSISNMSSFKH